MNQPASPRSARFVGKTLSGRYRVERVLSESASGVLFSAVDVSEERRVAVRLVYPEAAAGPEGRARIEREASVAARITHPGIAAGRPAGAAEDGSPLLVLPDLDGPTLRSLRKEGEVVPLARAAALVKQLALTLEALHKAGIIHRGLSPDCVYALPARVGERETVKLTDFGMARLGPNDRGPPLDRTSSAMAYAAPEVQRGGDADGRSDFYALGLLFYELVTGSRPMPERMGSLPSMTSIRSVPVAVDALALRLLAQDPARRASIAMEVVKALDALAEPAPQEKAVEPASRADAHPLPSSPAPSSPYSSPSSRGAPAGPPSAPFSRPLSSGRSFSLGMRDPSDSSALAVTASGGPASLKGAGGAEASGALVGMPLRMRFYIGGTAAIVLLIAAAVAMRPPLSANEATHRESSARSMAGARSSESPESSEPVATADLKAPEPPAAKEIRAHLEKSAKTGNASAFVADIERLIEIYPAALGERDIKETIGDVLMRIMLVDSLEADKLFELMELRMGPAGPDLLFELVTTRGGSRAAKRAEEVLRDAAVRSRGTPAMRIAYDLRTARCEDKAALLDRAKTEGDGRTLGQLQQLSQDCRRVPCCLSGDPQLRVAMDAIKERFR